MLTNNSTDYILESILKQILSDMLQLLEQNIRSDEELQLIQNQLQDYENLQQLAETILKKYFKELIINRNFSDVNQNQRTMKNQNKQYKNKNKKQEFILDQTQHEMKIFIDTIQQQLEESEQIRKEYLRETTQMIQKLKKENYNLIQQMKYFTQSYKKQTAQNSRRDSTQTINQQPSNSNHLRNNLEKQELCNNSQINKQQTQNNSLNQLLKNKDSQRSLAQRPLQSNRNRSYSVGISKQNFINSSFIQKLILEQGSKRKSLHAESHRSKGLIDQQKLSNK